jgi:hypothetical protein
MSVHKLVMTILEEEGVMLSKKELGPSFSQA